MKRLIEYALDVKRTAGTDLYVALGLVALGAALETIGLIAIFPFFTLIANESEVGGDTTSDGITWVSNALQRVGVDTALEQALTYSTVFLVILIVRALVFYQRDTKLFELNYEYIDAWRTRLFKAVANAKWSDLIAMDQSAIEHAIHSDITRLRSGTDTLLRALVSLTVAVVLIGAMLLIGGVTFVIVLVMLGLMTGISVILIKKADAMGRQITKSGRLRFRVLGQFMSTQKLARLHNSQDHFTRYFIEAVDRIRTEQVSFNASQAFARTIFSCMAGIAVILMFMLGYFWIEMSLPVLAICIIILARLAGPLQNLSQAGQAIANTLPTFESVRRLEQQFLASEQVIVPPIENSRDAVPFETLMVRGLSFAYPGTDRALFNKAELTVRAGETVVLRGRSGTGKTTLLDVLTGLMPPDAGDIWIDDKSLVTPADFQAFRQTAAFVPQDPFLFNATVRENLVSFGNGADVSEEDIWDALDCVEVGQRIREHDDALETLAGERGRQFSGGERQRLCLARALLRKPSLLILDEATNSLDRATEAAILERLRRQNPGLAILMVTHRDIAALNADRVYELENGTLSPIMTTAVDD